MGNSTLCFWIGIGLLCSVILFLYLLYDNEIKIDKQLLIYVCGIVGVIVGAKLFGVIKNFLLTLYNQEPLTVEILGSAGLVFYGGLLGFYCAPPLQYLGCIED